MRHICLAILLLALLPAAAAAAPPDVSTGAAESVGQTAVTLTGTLDPNGALTSYYFEYSTDTGFGLKTPSQAFLGDDPVPVKVRVSGLTPATTYRYRLVATNADGQQTGGERTVTTNAPPPPALSTLRTTAITATTAQANFNVNPRGSATTYHVDYGTSTSYGRSTSDQALPAGTASVRVAVPLAGLAPYRRHYWRVVATSAAGTTRSGRASFTTLRAPTGITLALDKPTVTWGGAVSPAGRVLGEGVSGIGVALQQSAFPFGAWTEVARASGDSAGRFDFGERTLFIATRFRVLTRTRIPVASAELGAAVRARASLAVSRRTRRSVRLRGSVLPALPTGRASLQRRTRSGKWVRVKRAALVVRDSQRSAYRVRAPRRRFVTRYRVAVVPQDGGAHATGYTRSVRVGRKRR